MTHPGCVQDRRMLTLSSVSRHQPLLATVILSGIISIFKSYPTLGDAAVWLGLLGCFPDIWDGMWTSQLLETHAELFSVKFSATPSASHRFGTALLHDALANPAGAVAGVCHG